jgi:Flp pilus assembly protein TadD
MSCQRWTSTSKARSPKQRETNDRIPRRFLLIASQLWAVYLETHQNLSAIARGRPSGEHPGVELANQANATLWRQITDPDPAKRSPEVALSASEPFLKVQPDNPRFLKTLGVARYRTGDFTGSIRDLMKCINLGTDSADAAFFLAAANAQMGHLDDAAKLFREADEWTRTYRPDDNDLKRFRDEAAAVLYMRSMDAARAEATKTRPVTPKSGAAPGAH